MSLKGKISILISREYTDIEIEDKDANTRFVKVRLTPEQLSMALSRQMSVDCALEVRELWHVGKKHENKQFEFEIPASLRSSDNYEELSSRAQDILDGKNEGWIADKYFASQGSFFGKDGKIYARCTIRRWI
jgi:hypothetical protein